MSPKARGEPNPSSFTRQPILIFHAKKTHSLQLFKDLVYSSDLGLELSTNRINQESKPSRMKFDKGVGDLGLTVTCSYVKIVIFFSENLPFSP